MMVNNSSTATGRLRVGAMILICLALMADFAQASASERPAMDGCVEQVDGALVVTVSLRR